MRLGVPILGTKKKSVVNAAAFLAALEGEQSGGISNDSSATVDPAASLRERLGLRMVGGSR